MQYDPSKIHKIEYKGKYHNMSGELPWTIFLVPPFQGKSKLTSQAATKLIPPHNVLQSSSKQELQNPVLSLPESTPRLCTADHYCLLQQQHM
jgi:hypothetical protein